MVEVKIFKHNFWCIFIIFDSSESYVFFRLKSFEKSPSICFFSILVPSSEETSFWPPSMVYISVIITHITYYKSCWTFCVGSYTCFVDMVGSCLVGSESSWLYTFSAHGTGNPARRCQLIIFQNTKPKILFYYGEEVCEGIVIIYVCTLLS